ncbi:MAG TPA: tRNA (5-methylaminomethyl-2-thiouridine)(34)-methyltransferase MnmD [Alphaproteobacteria bacterium]
MTRITHPQIEFRDNQIPVATDFGDIYFSPEDGLAETELVFLQGNKLPHAWQDQERFIIAETGFGTGLNFLATVKLFNEQPGKCRHLHYISVERHPLSAEQLNIALQPWRAYGLETQRLQDIYPLRIPGFHNCHVSANITLTLIFDDILKAFDDLTASVDAWFLDGFAPAKNPAMWNDSLYQSMARLSHAGTTLASFTAAGDVRRGLEAAGFTIERVSGFANKRHRIVGTFNGPAKTDIKTPQKIAIIGAGLAGATMAHALQRQGIDCTIFDRNPHSGLNASGNQLGLINPKLDVGHAAINDLGMSMYCFTLHRLRDMVDKIDLKQSGALHLATDETKAQRQQKIISDLSWLPEHAQIVDAQKANALSGVTISADSALYYPDAVTLNTAKMVSALLDHCDVRWEQEITSLAMLQKDYDAIIIASAEAAIALYPELHQIVQPMRGQVTYFKAPGTLNCPVIAGHYVAPVDTETWVTGATFQRQRTDAIPQDADDQTNLAALPDLLSNLPEQPEITDHWAQIRYTTPDRRPLLGQMAEDVYLATALGSHGLQYSFILAEILASQLTGAPLPVAKNVLDFVHLHRYQNLLS